MRFDEARVDNMRRQSGAPRSREPGIQCLIARKTLDSGFGAALRTAPE
jgi:hypothetical protein